MSAAIRQELWEWEEEARLASEDTMLDYDPDMPAGFNEADMEMAALTARANRSAALRRRGICDHGWWRSYGADGQWHGSDPAPPAGHARCLHCGADFPDPG